MSARDKIHIENSLNKPNAETLEAMREVEDMRSGKIPKYSMFVDEFIAEMENSRICN